MSAAAAADDDDEEDDEDDDDEAVVLDARAAWGDIFAELIGAVVARGTGLLVREELEVTNICCIAA